MKNLKLTTSLVCGGMLSLAGSSLLAQQSSSTDPSSSAARNAQTSSGALGASSSAYGSSSAMSSANNVRLSQIMNSSVQSQEGKTLGQIRDFVVDPQSGRIQFGVLSLSSAGAATDTSTSGRETVPSSRSSVAGTPSSASGHTMTGKLIPVPWQLFSQSWNRSQLGSSSTTAGSIAASGQNLVLNIDESKLRTAPSFDASNWNELQSLDQRVYSHYGVDRTSGIGTPGSTIRGQGTSGSTSDYQQRSPSSSTPQTGTTSPQSGTTSPQSGTTRPQGGTTTP